MGFIILYFPFLLELGMIYDFGFAKLGAIRSFWNFASIFDAKGHRWSQWRGVGLLISHPLHLAAPPMADSTIPGSRFSTYQISRMA